MIKVSDLAAKAISANSRTFLSRFLHNGAVISGDVRSVITHKGSCGESTFTPGAIYSSYIDVVIDNCKESLSGKELTYQIGVVIDENTTEWYDIGKYTVHKPSTDVYTTSFTALGRISAKLGMLYQSKLTFPTTIQNILDEISGNTGVSIIATGFDTSGVIENEITGYMYREVLAIIAGIFFAYATEDSAGNIVFANFKNGNIIRTDGDRTSVLPKFADMDTEITGVRVSGGEITVIDPETGDEVYQDQTFVSGNANVAIQNEFMTQALFDANAGNVIGFTFRPATVSISLGDFRIEPFDSLLVTDSLGVERTVPCMSIIHRFDGGIITEVVAPELQDDDSGTAFKGMFSQAIQRFQHDLISVKNLLAGTVTAEEIKANYATIENLNAANANIQKLQTDKLDASTADLKYATISNLNAAVGRISKLETDSLTAESAVIKALQTDKLDALAADLKYATISNLNAATASIEKLQADKLDASTADLKYATISNLQAAVGRISKLEADSLTAESAVIKNLQTEKLDAASADLKYATISNLNAATGRISKLETDSLTAESAIIKALQTNKLDAETADLRYATISSLNATNANITKLQSEKATVGQLEAVDGKIEDLVSKAITTENLSASVAELGYATVANLNAAVGRISKLETDSLTAESAVIKSLQTDKLDASSAELKYATISNLNAAVGRISKLETDSLTAESAIIKSLQSDLADIDTLIFGSATGTVIQTSFSNAVIARLGNAQIKSAMIDSLSADKITSGSINTNNVSIQSADGSMVIADNTIQIKDGSTVRVQIGKDASGNYSIVICDTDGNVMFNTNGITENAIKSAIIRDGMVATNANISASKLNIDSLFTEINDSTKTIKSTRIYMDDVGQTLDIAYNTAVTAVTNIGNTVNTHGTQISAIQGQITSKVWQQDIDTVKNSLDESIDTLSTQYSTLNQTVSGLNSTVASHTSQIASKADKSTLTTVSNKVTELEQSLDGFKLSVSSTYATKTTVNKTVKEVHRYYAPGGGVVILEECTPASNLDGYYLEFALNIIPGMTYTVYWNDTPYTTTAISHTENGITMVLLGDYGLLMGGTSTGEPFVMGTVAAENITQIISISGGMSPTVAIVSGTGVTPEKPTIYPPSSPWTETEPTSGGMCSTLCTVYVDGTFSYSDVSVNTAGDIAAGAMSTANNAADVAGNAQATADTAVSDAAAAQSKADSAYNKADTAQTGVNNLTTRVTKAESDISANAEQIALRATKTEIADTLGGYYTKAQTDAAITTSANQITSTVQSVEMIATTALSQGVEYIVGTQTAATNAWTGVTKSESLFVGKTIAYKLPYAGNSSAASLNLTLPDGTKTGAKELRRISSTVTTNYAAGTVINMTYDGTYWRIADYDSNTYDRIRYSQAIKCGTTAIVAANIIVGANGVYKHLKAGTAFDITYPILYASGAIAANATGTNNYVSMPFAVKTTQNLTLTAYKPVYIKGTLSGKMFTPVSTAPLTQTEPTSVDGYFYILLGTAYSTTNMYLLPEHPLFKYDNGDFKAIEQIVIENQSRITQTENSISSIVENYATKTEVTQTASDLTVTITQAQNTADTAKTAAENAQSTANTAKTNAATAQSTADTAKTNAATAQTTANNAVTAASNAAKTATNYLKFDSSGLLVGDMTTSTLGKNVLINSSGVEIRSGTTKLASFSANTIELGGVSTISKISLLNGIGVIEAVDRTGTYNSDSLSLSLNDDVTTNPTYLSMNAENTTLRAKAINIISGSGGLTLSAGVDTASIAVLSGFAMVNAPYFNIGNVLGSYSKQSEIPYLKWNTWNSKTPYFGYAQDQTDGTFVWSITGTNYASGLAIGGGTGNLLYKGSKVPTISDTATTSAAGVMSSDDKMKLNQTNITYGVCPTAAATAAKTVAITGNTKWVLTIGSIICIEFDYTNTASNPTLNVNGTGAKNIYYGTAQITTSNLSYAGYAGRKMMFMYDGTGYWFMGWSYDANTNTQLMVYRQDASDYNGDYPLIASRTKAASLGTVGTESSYGAVYGLISDTNANIPTTNPYTGEVKVKKLTVDGSTRLAVASARGNATNIALAAGAFAPATLNTWVVRNDSTFAFSDGGIKCPYAGNVMISGSVYFSGTLTDGMIKGVYITKNGAEVISQYIQNRNGAGSMTSGVAIIPVSAGDIIKLCPRSSIATTYSTANVATILNVAYV